ncbi:oxygen-insensitive NADPH nitroreductase [Sutcliffiella horikoshii]|uniref:oxygen-insensitive NADPH nitroreductase n=1 Tax=Sutcliffiella horikoshii TaxID=79883 RepID=UPI002040FC9F|nr:oxygen-insensitive NADPH nitroreductase [Sutcliffiella horikoshii]MCM3618060.1 oxygen-insensitive NADPH nitroreductase [Sutcliffiella horikoshii]
MNQTIETILSHKSVRKFEDKALTDEQIKVIVQSAQAASTSSFVQAYSIIGVKNKEKKSRLAELAGNQPYVEDSGHFFIFCADFHRHAVIGDMEGTDVTASIESTEKFMVALIDASLAAQNATVAAESMGLGICYIGGIRSNIQEVAELLKMPAHTIPLFGLAVGYPAQDTGVKPRLPMENIYHEDEYQQDEAVFNSQLEDYNKEISGYYNERTKGKRSDTWTSQMANMLRDPKRMHMKDFIEKQGFAKK